MKKAMFIVAIVATFGIVSFSCSSKTSETTEQIQEKNIEYTCPMHPEIITQKSGSCPKCGMDLVKKE